MHCHLPYSELDMATKNLIGPVITAGLLNLAHEHFSQEGSQTLKQATPRGWAEISLGCTWKALLVAPSFGRNY